MKKEAGLPGTQRHPVKKLPCPVEPEKRVTISSSLSSISPSSLLQNVQAALKRHRPLVSTKNIKPRRVMHLPPEAPRVANQFEGRVAEQKKHSKGNVLRHSSLISSKNHSSTNEVHDKLVNIKFRQLNGCQNGSSLLIPEKKISQNPRLSDEESNARSSSECSTKETQEDVQIPMRISENIKERHDMIAPKKDLYDGVKESTKHKDDALPNVESLALEEKKKVQFSEQHLKVLCESDHGKETNAILDEPKHESMENGASLYAFNAKQIHPVDSSLTQSRAHCLAVGPSPATTASTHSAYAPIPISTNGSISRQINANSCVVADPIIGTSRSSQQNASQDLKPPPPPPLPVVVETHQIPISKTDPQINEQNPDMGRDFPRECNPPKNPPQGCESKADITDIQSQAPLSKNTSSLKPTSSKPDNEKASSVSSKSTVGPRKRNYDPDLFFKVNGKLYQRLGKIGSGGSSEVHKVISSDCTMYALKKIKLKGRDYATAYGFYQEIEYLKKLKGNNNIIQLIDYEVTDKNLFNGATNGSSGSKEGRIKDDSYIYMVLEYGEIDLAHMLAQKWKEVDTSHRSLDENWLRFYWQQMLQAVNIIHEERIVHSDLKPANFLLVKGSLKLIDFGIAKAIQNDTTNIQRDSQVGTLSYMSPEAFMCNERDGNGNPIKCGRPSDIWSLGCILYQMVYGRTPFSEYRTFWAKLKIITDPDHKIAYEPVSNPWLMDLMKKCLAWDRNKRWKIPQLLCHPFLVLPTVPHDPLNLSEACAGDPEAMKLLSELHRLLGLVGPLTREHQSKLLTRVSSVCYRLHEHLEN